LSRAGTESRLALRQAESTGGCSEVSAMKVCYQSSPTYSGDLYVVAFGQISMSHVDKSSEQHRKAEPRAPVPGVSEIQTPVVTYQCRVCSTTSSRTICPAAAEAINSEAHSGQCSLWASARTRDGECYARRERYAGHVASPQRVLVLVVWLGRKHIPARSGEAVDKPTGSLCPRQSLNPGKLCHKLPKHRPRP